MRFNLDDNERELLLRIARDAIGAGLRDSAPTTPENITENVKKPCGAFVTLTIGGALRGCIGYIETESPLYQTVMSAAKSAAFYDTRFSPLDEDEFEQVKIEISVLSPPAPVESWKDIQVGRHGIILSKWGRRAVFLPQVAAERGWDIATTLTHLAMKAGLAPDDWREGARLEVFEALIIEE